MKKYKRKPGKSRPIKDRRGQQVAVKKFRLDSVRPGDLALVAAHLWRCRLQPEAVHDGTKTTETQAATVCCADRREVFCPTNALSLRAFPPGCRAGRA
ncbi:MAG: hypothetical protein IT488_05230 [Gammaproteobacteria bacterium]|nr:hypothetical protein [Gammaproteobacteria bacterium]